MSAVPLSCFRQRALTMAEDEAEKAFFQAQAMNADSVDYNAAEEQGADSSDSDDYDPSKTLQDQYSAPLTDSKNSDLQDISSSDVAPSTSDPTKQSSLPREMDPNQQTSGTYPSQTPSRAESRASSSMPSSILPVQPKTRTIGGFVVEDDDEDDKGEAEYEPPAVLGGIEDVGTGSASMPQHSLSENANQTVSTSDVSLQPAAPELANSKDVSNSSYSPAPVPSQGDGSSSVPGQDLYNAHALQAGHVTDSPAPTPPSAATSAPRGRLPHDRVGILEDRIQEDPRGDIAAWLELIGEHRSRNKIESARETYERFFKVFPHAVRPSR